MHTTIVTNRHPRTPLGVPGVDQAIDPGKSAPVPAWDVLLENNAIIRAWADRGWLVAEEVEPEPLPADETPEAPQATERDLLLSELEARGVEHDKRWGVRKLQAALDEHIASISDESLTG